MIALAQSASGLRPTSAMVASLVITKQNSFALNARRQIVLLALVPKIGHVMFVMKGMFGTETIVNWFSLHVHRALVLSAMARN